MTLTNPCINPNLSPIRIELSHIPYKEYHEQYDWGVKVVKGYWQQAINMTIEDQVEYKTLIEQRQFDKQGFSKHTPNSHGLYESCQASPTWAKYVFLKALYDNVSMPTLDSQVQGSIKCTIIEDLETYYHNYYPKQARETKRKATEQLQPLEAQRTTSSSELKTLPLLNQTSHAINDLESLEVRLKKYIDNHFKEVRENILERLTGQGEMIRTTTQKMPIVIHRLRRVKEDLRIIMELTNQLGEVQGKHLDTVTASLKRMTDTTN